MTYLKHYLHKEVTIKIDRPLGSKHPEYGNIYPINYGYIPNTMSPDGKEIDAYVLGVDESLNEFTGKCIAIVHRKNDNEDKLVLAPKNIEFSINQIKQNLEFQEQYFDSTILTKH